MPIFTKHMLAPLEQALSNEKQIELNNALYEIYDGDCRDYENKDNDFEVCKQQLLLLLGHIYSLDNQSLRVFKEFADNVSKLTTSSTHIDLLLKFTKDSIERSLLAIMERHGNIDKNAFNHLTVSDCYPGAAASIEWALSHFKTNKLFFYVKNALSDCLLQLAKEYLIKHELIDDIIARSEIHWVHALHNCVSDDYGVTKIKDAFAANLEPETVTSWKNYLAAAPMMLYFLRCCQASFESLPFERIDNAESLKRLHDFFNLFNQPFNKAVYLQLYDEHDDDKGNDYLVPKNDFSWLYFCLLADYLQQAGFFEGLITTIDDKRYFYNGEQLVGISGDVVHSYHPLSLEELLPLIDNPLFKELELWRQLSADLLMNRYFQEPNDKYFEHLITLTLTENMISRLFGVIDSKKKEQLAIYVFTHRYDNFSIQTLDKISDLLPEQARKKIINYTIRTDDDLYLVALLKRFPYMLDDTFVFSAAKAGAVEIITYLSKMDSYVDLTIKNDRGENLLHIAAENGRVAVVSKLCELGADVGTKDNHGLTPLHIAALSGHLEIISKLCELGADVEAKTNKGNTPLHIAAQNGHFEIVRKLQESDADINAKNNYGWTALHMAAISGDVDVIGKLCELGAFLDTKDNDNRTPLHLAAISGHIAVVSKLCELGADVEAKTNKGNTPLHIAAQNDHFEIVRKLQESDADINAKNNYGWTALHMAAISGDVDVIGKLCELGAFLDTKDNDNRTPLHLAAISGHIAVVSKLHEAGADIKAKNNDGWTALHIAAQNGHIAVVSKLHEAGADLEVKNNNGSTPLHIAALSNHMNVVSKLCELRADIDAKANDGWTPLHMATQNGHLDIVSRLREAGADINAKANDGWTALHMVAENGHIAVVSKLQELGADVEAKTNMGNTPLHIAAQNGHLEIVSKLHEAGANVDAKNNNGRTPLHMAAQNGHITVVSKLQELGADVEAKTNMGNTPLHIAAQNGHLEIVSKLDEAGANVDAKNNNGRTPLHMAAQNGHITVVSKLHELGADINAKTNYGSTPAYLAKLQNHIDVITKLSDLGADMTTPSENNFFFALKAMATIGVVMGGAFCVIGLLTLMVTTSPVSSVLMMAGFAIAGSELVVTGLAAVAGTFFYHATKNDPKTPEPSHALAV